MAKVGRPKKYGEKMVTIVADVPPKYKECIEYVAGYGERTKSDIVREAIKEWLEKKKFI